MNPSSALRRPANRREFLYGLGATLGTVAFNALLRGDAAATTSQAAGSLTARSPHHLTKAKACIFLFMEGGPSHIDTFDPKVRLHDLHMKEFDRREQFASAMANGKRYYVQSPFRFRKAGQAGIDLCEHFQHLAGVADELCVYRGCVAESIDHPTACYHMNTGNRFGGDPAIGAWTTYGLGSQSANLPAFVVLPEVAFPQGGGGELVKRLSARFLSGYSSAAQRCADSGLEPTRRCSRRTAASQSGSTCQAQLR